MRIILILIVVAGVAAIVWLLNRARDEAARPAMERQEPPVASQELSALALPYRTQLGEAVTIQQEVAARAEKAPPVLRNEIRELSQRMYLLVRRALPRAKHGTQLKDFLLRLTPADAEFEANRLEADGIEQELEQFVEQMRRVRGKVYGILSNAASLQADRRLDTDLKDALSDVQSLEEAMSEAVKESSFLS